MLACLRVRDFWKTVDHQRVVYGFVQPPYPMQFYDVDKARFSLYEGIAAAQLGWNGQARAAVRVARQVLPDDGVIAQCWKRLVKGGGMDHVGIGSVTEEMC
ncbi:MAG: hypothetical protein FRX48_03851 [Lasallia pustulata]|uniref:Uncharacterized protein n=1 Tax=Lasallia pustulata TaxID=136370 RepID=A0A5M8PTE4_9LECA|nr:MAG: hypothetical protein FRX48_03851 [Lasallia pustulata]